MTTLVFLLILLAATIHAAWNFAAKKVAGDIAVIWIGLVMVCAVFAPFVLFIDPGQIAFREVIPFIIASGVFNTFYFFALARAYEHGEISVVYPVARGFGIAGTALLAGFLLRESVTSPAAVGIAIVIIGILLISLRGGHHRHSLLYALLVGAMTTGYSITDKFAVGISHPFFYNFAFTVLFTLLLAPYVLIKKQTELKEAWRTKKKYSFIIGFGTACSYLIILFVLQIADVSRVIVVREFSVVIGSILGFIFLKEKFTWRKFAGIAAVVAGIILVKLS